MCHLNKAFDRARQRVFKVPHECYLIRWVQQQSAFTIIARTRSETQEACTAACCHAALMLRVLVLYSRVLPTRQLDRACKQVWKAS